MPLTEDYKWSYVKAVADVYSVFSYYYITLSTLYGVLSLIVHAPSVYTGYIGRFTCGLQ